MKKQRCHYAWLIMISCCAVMIAGIGITVNCAGIFYQPVSEALGVGRGVFSMYVTIRALVLVVMFPIAGKVLRKFDIRLVLSIAFAVMAASVALMSRFTALYQFYVVGAVQGVFSSVFMTLPVPMLINSWFHKRVGFVMGVVLAFSGIGGMIFNPVGNWFIVNYGWQSGYLAFAAFTAILSLPFTIFVLRNKPSDKGLEPYGADEVASGQAIVDKPESPGLSKPFYRYPAFYLLALFASFANLVTPLTQHMPGFATSSGFSATAGANVVSLIMMGIILGKVLIGFLSDRFGINVATATAVILAVIGVLGLMFNGGRLVMVYPGAVLLGVGGAITTVSPPIAVTKVFGREAYSSVYSWVSTVNALVAAFGLTLFGLLYDMSGTYTYDFIVLMIALPVGLLCLITAGKLSAKSAAREQPAPQSVRQ